MLSQAPTNNYHHFNVRQRGVKTTAKAVWFRDDYLFVYVVSSLVRFRISHWCFFGDSIVIIQHHCPHFHVPNLWLGFNSDSKSWSFFANKFFHSTPLTGNIIHWDEPWMKHGWTTRYPCRCRSPRHVPAPTSDTQSLWSQALDTPRASLWRHGRNATFVMRI